MMKRLSVKLFVILMMLLLAWAVMVSIDWYVMRGTLDRAQQRVHDSSSAVVAVSIDQYQIEQLMKENQSLRDSQDSLLRDYHRVLTLLERTKKPPIEPLVTMIDTLQTQLKAEKDETDSYWWYANNARVNLYKCEEALKGR